MMASGQLCARGGRLGATFNPPYAQAPSIYSYGSYSQYSTKAQQRVHNVQPAVEQLDALPMEYKVGVFMVS
jgi:hypothetical protein